MQKGTVHTVAGKMILLAIARGSVADPHNFDADPCPDLDPACHIDADPDSDPADHFDEDLDPDQDSTFHFYADPDPSFQNKGSKR